MQVAAGQFCSFVMVSDGSIWAWGRNSEYGDLGVGGAWEHHLSPVRVDGYGADTSARLPLGGNMARHMFVVLPDGTVKGSGANGNGQMGVGGTTDVRTAVAIPQLGSDVLQISRGERHTLVLKGE